MSPIRLRGSRFPLAASLRATKRGGVRGILLLTSGATLLSLTSGATLLSLSSGATLLSLSSGATLLSLSS